MVTLHWVRESRLQWRNGVLVENYFEPLSIAVLLGEEIVKLEPIVVNLKPQNLAEDFIYSIWVEVNDVATAVQGRFAYFWVGFAEPGTIDDFAVGSAAPSFYFSPIEPI